MSGSKTPSGLADAESVVDKMSFAHNSWTWVAHADVHLNALRRRKVHSFADIVQDDCQGMYSHND